MATKLYLRTTNVSGITPNYGDLSLTAGSSALTNQYSNVSAGNTEVILNRNSGFPLQQFVTDKVAVDFTLTSVGISVWLNENSATTNIGGRFRMFTRAPDGTETEIGGGPFDLGSEVSTSATEYTWTGNVTDTAIAAGDRIVLRVYATNIGTMGNGSGTLSFNGADGGTADSFITLAEDASFISTVQQTIGSRARIRADTIRIATTKARIRADTVKNIETRARIKATTLKTIESRALIEAITLKTIESRAVVANLGLKTIESRAFIVYSGTQNIGTKARIFTGKVTDVDAISGGFIDKLGSISHTTNIANITSDMSDTNSSFSIFEVLESEGGTLTDVSMTDAGFIDKSNINSLTYDSHVLYDDPQVSYDGYFKQNQSDLAHEDGILTDLNGSETNTTNLVVSSSSFTKL